MVPPPPLETDLGYLGRELEKFEEVSKKGSSRWSFSKKGRQMLASQKSRQLFVAVKMAPSPVSKFLNTPLCTDKA
jgi:hypothetical protein